MKWLAISLVLAFLSLHIAWGENLYTIHLNLMEVKRDRVKITIFPPPISRDRVEYQLPLVVPGTYAFKSYNQFVKKFRVYDANNKRLNVRNYENRRFVIYGAKNLYKIEYWIEDTWDFRNPSEFVFQPMGTNIQEQENFLINHFGFFGYIRGYKYFPFKIHIDKPAGFHGATGLKKLSSTYARDTWFASSYRNLIDNPIMYSKPDTTSFFVKDTRINISVYSANKVVTASRIVPFIRQVTDAVHRFFDGIPVPQYSFLFYFAGYQQQDIKKSKVYGALEHKSSSVYFLPEIYSDNELKKNIQSIAIHEMLHLLTPLNFRSNKTVYFNLLNPEMTSHLWLYEGVTEYFTYWLMLTEGLITEEEFINEMRYKIIRSSAFEPLSFTEMSKNILKEPYKEWYENVYEKGAILGLLLDIRIHELTNSKHNLREVVLQMASEYGSEPFNDETFIDDFVSRVHPDLSLFFEKYIIGTEPLPVNEYFEKLGWEYIPSFNDTIYSFGKINYRFDPGRKTFNIDNTHPRHNLFSLRGGEQIISINDYEVTPENYTSLFYKIIQPKDNAKVKLKVKSNETTYSLLAEPMPVKATQHHKIHLRDDVNDYQLNLKNNLFYLQ